MAPSDHLILNEDDFLRIVQDGLNFVSENDNLLTLGIKPNRPETGYGYIQVDNKIDNKLYKVKTFTEKPELDLAKVFVESGEFYWNSGLFLWNVQSITKAINEHLPDIAIKLKSDKYNTADEQSFIDESFPLCSNISMIWINGKSRQCLCYVRNLMVRFRYMEFTMTCQRRQRENVVLEGKNFINSQII